MRGYINLAVDRRLPSTGARSCAREMESDRADAITAFRTRSASTTQWKTEETWP